MRTLYRLFNRVCLLKAIAAALCFTVLSGGLTGCGKKGPPVAPRQAQSDKSNSGDVSEFDSPRL